MVISAAVCEFNPFHTGHKYFLEQMKKDGTTHTVCIMSGNFVQRGEGAICDKFIRASHAVQNGADLVIELPLPYAVATAETFARGAVGMLHRLNVADRLYFGMESSLDDIVEAIKISESDEFKEKIKSLLDTGLSYPTAFDIALCKKVCRSANDVLAMEYIKQLQALNSTLAPHAIKRLGASHDSQSENEEHLSASLIRQYLKSGKDCRKYLPCSIPPEEISRPQTLDLAALAKLRGMSESEFEQTADVTEGLQYRLKKSVATAKSVDDIIQSVKTKRYTTAKIRRIVLCSFLGITKQMQLNLPRYVNVLACNKKGFEIIAKIKENSDICVVTKFSDTKSLSPDDMALYEFTSKCDDLYYLSLKEIREVGYDKTRRFSPL